MSRRHLIRRALSGLVYVTAITLGAGLLVVHPVRALLAVPILTGIVVLGHAVKTNQLDELGYATMWLWAAVLVLSAGWMVIEGGVLAHRNSPPVVEIPVARVLGTLGLLAVLVAAYVRGVQQAGRDERQSRRLS